MVQAKFELLKEQLPFINFDNGTYNGSPINLSVIEEKLLSMNQCPVELGRVKLTPKEIQIKAVLACCQTTFTITGTWTTRGARGNIKFECEFYHTAVNCTVESATDFFERSPMYNLKIRPKLSLSRAKVYEGDLEPRIGNAIFAAVEDQTVGSLGLLTIRILRKIQSTEVDKFKIAGEITSEVMRAIHRIDKVVGKHLKSDQTALQSYNKSQFLISFGEGSVSGPSFGLSFAVAFLSLLTGKKPKEKAAFTGVVDSVGNVIEIGGLQHKSKAAFANRYHSTSNGARDGNRHELSKANTIYVKNIKEIETLMLS